MCRSPTHAFLAALPKCEHHIHLEGSLAPSLLFTLAHQNKIALPSPEDDPSFASPVALLDRYTHFTSLDNFLHYYFIGIGVLIHAQDFEALAWDYFVRAKADGVVHAEVFFDPQAHTTRGVHYTTVRDGFKKACDKAEKDLGISTKLILCFLRDKPVMAAEATLEEARKDLESGLLSGVGLDSSEKQHPPGCFREVYKLAKAAGGRLTVHAGEEGPAEYIREALKELDVERIDHGIHLVDDLDLMKELAERRVLLTVCPLSNYRLRAVKEIRDLPIRTFLNEGVRFSLNSDDPAYFGGYILDNYCAVQEAFSLTVKEWENIATAAIEGSWCDAARKRVLLKQLSDVVEKPHL
ncbi:adenine deaminase [Pseudocyphellaria aurata]|nr:adenine deaminase [Pseudocyphellaria aurata]